MALIEMTTRRPATAGSISSMISSLMNWNSTRVTRKKLFSLTERELDDIGLNRADIDLLTFTRQG